MSKLLLLDCDGTIREPASGGKFIQNPKDQKIIKGADWAIAHYYKESWTVVGITNQAGVAAGHKQLVDALTEAEYTLKLFPEIVCIYLCPDFEGRYCWLIDRDHDALPIHLADWAIELVGTFRKPQPGMLKAAITNHIMGKLTDSNCWYIGDRWEDLEAAMRAGVQYMDADIWRERWLTREYIVNAVPTHLETQLVINWLKDVIGLFFEPISDHVQNLINNERLDEECLNYMAKAVFDDLTPHLEREYQPPEIETEQVNWKTIGLFLVSRLNLELWRDHEPW